MRQEPMCSLLATALLQKRVTHDYLSQAPIFILSLQPCRDDLPQIWGPNFQSYTVLFLRQQMACVDTAKDVCDVRYRQDSQHDGLGGWGPVSCKGTKGVIVRKLYGKRWGWPPKRAPRASAPTI